MSDDLESGTDHTHYCEDCEVELELMYDAREDDDEPIVCGHCGGTNTRPLALADGGRSEAGVLQRIKAAFTGPTPGQVREKYSPAGECPNCGSDDYWKKSTYTGTMYRCLNCRAEGLGK